MDLVKMPDEACWLVKFFVLEETVVLLVDDNTRNRNVCKSHCNRKFREKIPFVTDNSNWYKNVNRAEGYLYDGGNKRTTEAEYHDTRHVQNFSDRSWHRSPPRAVISRLTPHKLS